MKNVKWKKFKALLLILTMIIHIKLMLKINLIFLYPPRQIKILSFCFHEKIVYIKLPFLLLICFYFYVRSYENVTDCDITSRRSLRWKSFFKPRFTKILIHSKIMSSSIQITLVRSRLKPLTRMCVAIFIFLFAHFKYCNG